MSHPHPSRKHVMRIYRKYLIGQKRVWMSDGAGNRCLRGLMKYRLIVNEYIAAKRDVLRGMN